jgi:hypothetical protein
VREKELAQTRTEMKLAVSMKKTPFADKQCRTQKRYQTIDIKKANYTRSTSRLVLARKP